MSFAKVAPGDNSKMRKYKYDKIIKIVIDWWANALLNPKYDNGAGDDPLALFIKAKSPKITSPQIKFFKDELARYLKVNLNFKKKYAFCLGVDYTPDFRLSQCLRSAGIDSSIISLPWKTNMWISENKISVRCGYGAHIQILYSIN